MNQNKLRALEAELTPRVALGGYLSCSRQRIWRWRKARTS